MLQANPEDAQSAANLSRLNVVQSLWREGAPHTGGAPLVLADTSLRTDSHADLQRLHKPLSDIRKGTATLVGSPERLPGPSGGSAPGSNIRDLLSQGANLQGFTDDLLNSEQQQSHVPGADRVGSQRIHRRGQQGDRATCLGVTG